MNTLFFTDGFSGGGASIASSLLICCIEVRDLGKKGRELDWPKGVALAVLSLSFLLGGCAGCVLAGLAGGEGGRELSAYLTDYLAAVDTVPAPGLWTVLWEHGKILLAALLLGLTALGVLGLPLLFGVRGFFFTFSVACFCRVFGTGGALPSFVLFALPALLWAPALFLAGTQSLRSSRQLLGRALGEERTSPVFGKPSYWCTAGLCAGLTLAGCLLECWVVPVLLRAAARSWGAS